MSEQIRIATNDDICAIREIWRKIFTANEEYLDIIFNELYPQLDAFVYTIESKIVSVAFAIPLNLSANIESNTTEKSSQFSTPTYFKGRYLYGVATTEEARGKGLSKEIVKKIREHYSNTGEDFIITRPAEESLFPFYKAQGFKKSLYRREININLHDIPCSNFGEKPDKENSELTAHTLYRLRNAISAPLFLWNESILAIILKLAKTEEKAALIVDYQDQYCIAFCNGLLTDPQKEIIVLENNFRSTEDILKNLLRNTELITEETENIFIITPAKISNNLNIYQNKSLSEKIKIKEFALFMPLSGKISDKIIENSFFNFTME